jgi:nicotinamidase-related amidase
MDEVFKEDSRMMRIAVEQGRTYMMIAGVLLIPFYFCIAPVHAADEKSIIDLWGTVVVPPPVDLKAVKVEPAKTAFLVLDIEQRTCNAEARPRCVAAVPGIKAFLEKARAKGLLIVYSLTNLGTPETILPGMKPLGTEPIVKSSVDKFYNTELEKILREKGIETVIIVGTTAEGAVLHTATAAAMRGFQVIVPIDGMSAGTLYAEQYTAWHLVNAPGSRQRTTLTRWDMIEL